MHQQRQRVSSPANAPQTNPSRTNNPRDALAAAGRARAGSETSPHDSTTMPDSAEGAPSGPSRESIKRLDQVIQVCRRGRGSDLVSRG